MIKSNNKKKVILLGKGILVIQIAEWFLKSNDHELCWVVPVIPEPTWTTSFLKWAKENNVPAIESGHYKDIPGVDGSDFEVDLTLSVFYDKIIKEWFILKCRKILNIHNSPLPKYRGVSPINWALKNNETEHGVTIHEITPEIDDGSIVAQIKYSIYLETDEVEDVFQRALKYAFLLFEQTMPILDKIKPIPQDDSMATYYNEKQKDKLGDRRDFTREKSKNN